MGRASRFTGQKSTWERTGPNTRLMVGATIISFVGLLGLTPNRFLSIELIWPYAALWGAAGWATVGLALRPMFILAIFGVAQDVVLQAPIGTYLLVNLATYGIVAAFSDSLDIINEPANALAVSALAMAGGMVIVWIVASSRADQAMRITPLLGIYLTTLLLFVPFSGLFRLGGRPGEKLGGVL
ncbi:MAG: hypothetical protein AAGJ29_04780 [Pseudomonadota bacterium]